MATSDEAKLTELERLRIERDYLLERSMRAGKIRFGMDRDTGVSSNALVRYAFTGEKPSPGEFPGDLDDLRSCYNARENAPEHLRSLMDEVLGTYRKAVGKRHPEVLDGDDWRWDAGGTRQGMPISEFLDRLDEIADQSP